VVDFERSRAARAAAETALVRVVHHYGSRPEFVLLGGLVPELLCAGSEVVHAGTTDVDVQVDLEVAAGSVNAVRLERALLNAEFLPDPDRSWRWQAEGPEGTVVKFELLADLGNLASLETFTFDECKELGAVNLRGTGFASRDVEVHEISARVADLRRTVEINVVGLAGFLLAKAAAAHGRAKPKDWYDIAFVLLHNTAGGPGAAAAAVLQTFPSDLGGSTRTSLDELRANFSSPDDQGSRAYSSQMNLDHPDQAIVTLAADAVAAVNEFYDALFP
jgi:hypothetical protein